MRDKIFEYIKRVMAVAHTGLTYSKDEFAIDNYQELLEMSKEMLHDYTNKEIQPYDIYHEVYYPTPQPVTRTFIVQDGKVLFVREAKDHCAGKWSLPGGWCDVTHSAEESAIKEVKEETGYDVKITRLLGLMHRGKYIESKMYDTYNIFFLAEIIGGSANPNFEVLEVDWFSMDDLPELSTKTTKEELLKIWNHYQDSEDSYFE